MAIDAGVYSLFNHPTTELLDPFELQRRRLGIQNALAGQQLQQQAITGGGLDIDLKRRAIADAEAERLGLMRLYGVNPDGTPLAAAAGAPAPAPAPAGVPGPDAGGSAAWSPGVAQIPMSAPGSAAWGPGAPPPDAAVAVPPPAATPAPGGAPPSPAAIARRSFTMSDLLQAGVPITKAPEVLGHLQAAEKQSAEIQGLRDKSAEVMQEYAAEMANGWIKSGNNPAVLGLQLQHFAAHGPEYAQMASKIAQTFQSDPEAASAWMKSLAVGTKDARAASSREQEVQNQTDKTTDELRVSRTKQYGGLLGSTRDKASYDSVLKRLDQIDPKLADDAGFDREWTPQSAALAKQKGMSAQEQVTTAEAAKRDQQTASYQNQEIGIQRGHLAIAQREEQRKITATAGQSYAQLNPNQKLIAEKLASGDYRMSVLSRFPAGEKEAIMGGALELNKNLSDMTYETKESFTNPEKKQATNLGTISRIVGHIGRYELNSGRMGVSPGYGLGFTVTGDQKSIAADAHAISAELEKLSSGGVGTKEQVREWQDLLRSSLPENRQRAIDEISQIVGSQYEGMNQSWRAGMGSDLPIGRYVSPAGRAWMKSKGITVGADPDPAPAGGAPAAPAAAAGSSASAAGKPLADHSTDELLNLLVKK